MAIEMVYRDNKENLVHWDVPDNLVEWYTSEDGRLYVKDRDGDFVRVTPYDYKVIAE